MKARLLPEGVIDGKWQKVWSTNGKLQFMLSKIALSIIATIIVASTVMLASASCADAEATKEASVSKYMYLFGAYGEFMKIDMNDYSVDAHGHLPLLEGVKGVIPPYNFENKECSLSSYECHWRVLYRKYDEKRGRLLLTVDDDDFIEAERQGIGRVPNSRVGFFQLPEMKMVHVMELADLAHEFLFTPDGEKMLVYSFRVDRKGKSPFDDMKINYLDVYDADSYEKIASQAEIFLNRDWLEKETFFLTSSARFIDDHTIRDRRHISEFIDNKLQSKFIYVKKEDIFEVLGKAKFDTETRKIVNEFELKVPNFSRMGFRGGVDRYYVRLDNKEKNISALLLINPENNTLVTPLILHPYKRRVIFFDDNKKVLLKEYAERQDQYGNSFNYVTGRFWAYDVETGKEIRSFTVEQVVGREFGESAMLLLKEGRYLVFWKSNVYIIDLYGEKETVEIPVSPTLVSDGLPPMAVLTDR